MAAICPDFKWILDPIQNPDHLETFLKLLKSQQIQFSDPHCKKHPISRNIRILDLLVRISNRAHFYCLMITHTFTIWITDLSGDIQIPTVFKWYVMLEINGWLYSNHLNTRCPNSGFIWSPDFMSDNQMVWLVGNLNTSPVFKCHSRYAWKQDPTWANNSTGDCYSYDST